MRIVDLAEFYSERGGGVRSYLTKQMRWAGEHGHELVVVAPGPKDETVTMPGGRVVRYAAPPMPYDPTYHVPWRVDRMRQVVRALAPDVLQVSSPFVPALVARSIRDVPVRAYVHHSDPINCYVRPLAARMPPALADRLLGTAWDWLRAVCDGFDVVVVAGHGLRRELEQWGCQRVRAVPFGIEHERFGPEHGSLELRRQLLGPLADDPAARLLAIAGRLAADKRQAMLVQAVVEVARRRPVALVVLGDGPERERLRELAHPLPAATFMRFTKDPKEYATLLASVDLLVHGSACETYGFVLVETLASGTPIVVPDEGAAASLAPPGASVVYAARGGPPAVAEAIERALEIPRDAARDAAVRAARAQPHLDEHFAALVAAYDEIRASRGGGQGKPNQGTEIGDVLQDRHAP
ncbi:MAG: glycosyltransferase [Myxococcales bacterium]|nr:glycosyltransferase [Myxococcales bacterium]